jgi:hypothetical protein
VTFPIFIFAKIFDHILKIIGGTVPSTHSSMFSKILHKKKEAGDNVVGFLNIRSKTLNIRLDIRINFRCYEYTPLKRLCKSPLQFRYNYFFLSKNTLGSAWSFSTQNYLIPQNFNQLDSSSFSFFRFRFYVVCLTDITYRSPSSSLLVKFPILLNY